MRPLRCIGIALVAVALAWALSPLAYAQTDPIVPYVPGNGLSDSPHDFTNATVLGAYSAAGGSGVAPGQCQTCHIAHAAQSNRAIWNHTLSTQAYSWEDVSTSNGTTLPTSFSGNSRFCLSCHDGTVAVGDLQDSPAGPPAGLTNPADWGTDLMGAAVGGNDKRVAVSGNMSKNHPVGVPYAGQTYGGVLSGVSAAQTTAEWVSVATVGTNDVVKLFLDGGSGIECGSCHEVHNRGAAAPATSLLRDTAAAICAECHNK